MERCGGKPALLFIDDRPGRRIGTLPKGAAFSAGCTEGGFLAKGANGIGNGKADGTAWIQGLAARESLGQLFRIGMRFVLDEKHMRRKAAELIERADIESG